MKRQFLFLIFIGLFTSCYQNIEEPVDSFGYRPIYRSSDSLNIITVSGPKSATNTGKIYAYGKLLFQNEVNQGFHVISIEDPKNPVKKAFYSIPLSTEISIKDDFLYTNNGKDLIVISIAKYMNPKYVRRLSNRFQTIDQNSPSNVTSGYFECPDPSKGYIIGWEQVRLNNPKCRK